MTHQIKPLLFTACMLAVLSACSSIKLNPFSSGTKERSAAPENATAYVCDGNKQFYVRLLNNGNDAWLIYPDHEVNLSNATENKNRYTSGVITLLINGDQTTLDDGEKIAYTGCKAQAKK